MTEEKVEEKSSPNAVASLKEKLSKEKKATKAKASASLEKEVEAESLKTEEKEVKETSSSPNAVASLEEKPVEGKSLEDKKKELLENPEIKISDSQRAKELEDKKRKLLEKAKKLKEKVEKTTTAELKEKVRIKKRTDMLIPLEEYVKAGIYLGTKVVTPAMRPFVYRRRADGLAIFNTDLIDEKLKEGIEYLSKFAPEDVILVCKRQAGWKAAEKFSELTGIRVFTKKYPAGLLTNTDLDDFFENELTIITDSWLDKNALRDTINVHKKVLMVCDTNNFAKGADQIIIGNNKSPKSLGIIFYLLTRGYCKARGIDANIPNLEWWTGEE